MTSYYNEFDNDAADKLQSLIDRDLIPFGHVDRRSICDVRAIDLVGYKQCHFFAGIGGWPLALRMAGWSDDRRVWTGSCPCQPFSVANAAGIGIEDKRHLLPEFTNLIGECRPPSVFGEQVPGAIGKGWLDEAFGRMEAHDYACAATILPAIAFGARHERKRLYWMANSSSKRWERHIPLRGGIPSFGEKKVTEYGNPLAIAGKALDGDFSGLLLGDGVSVGMERKRVKGYGNAIVPQVAAFFIRTVMALDDTK